jgi:hypothetical protein
MTKILRISAIALLALLTFAPVAEARGRHFGGSYGFGYFHSFAFYPGFYGPGWYGPYYGPYWGPGYYVGPRTGQIKIETKLKGNSIFVDGGYAGVTGQLKKIPLRPGTHTIELRNPAGRTIYQERVHVLRGKTLKIRVDFPG